MSALGLTIALGGCSGEDSGGGPTTPTSPPTSTPDMPSTQSDAGSDDQGADLAAQPDVAIGVDMSPDASGGADMTAPDMPSQDCSYGAPVQQGVVLTRQGAVSGVEQDGSWAFLGIPFAAPPVDQLRFRPPQPPSCWGPEARDATRFGPKCVQPTRNRNGQPAAPTGDEDCLHLNVWTEAGYSPASQRPVMVFIHGGGNIIGSASETLGGGRAFTYAGADLAVRQDVVLVTIQYRLGPLGNMALAELQAESVENSTGNYGLLDQVAALEWVRDNIAQFGGDPDNVMIFGESAGAVNTCMMLTTPLAAGLFDAALMQSGACTTRPMATAVSEHRAALGETGCEEADDLLSCLRALPAYDLVEAMPSTVGVGIMTDVNITFGPIVDGWVLPQSTEDTVSAGMHNKVPLVVGSNADEFDTNSLLFLDPQNAQQYDLILRAYLGNVLAQQAQAAYPVGDYDSPRDALVQVLTDAWFTCSARRIARLVRANQQEPVYRYFFSRRAETPRGETPAAHGIELVYIFNTLDDIPFFTPVQTDSQLAVTMGEHWANFAKRGDPSPEDSPGLWPPYDGATDPYIIIDDPIGSGMGLRSAKCDFWDGIGFRQ